MKTAGKMKELMGTKENNGMLDIEVMLEKFYFDENSDDETSDTYQLLVEQLNRMKTKVRGE